MYVEMASSEEPSCCESDPNFAIICAFLEKFGVTCGLNNIDFLELQAMLENTQEVPQTLVDLHIKLLRKARKSVSNERWERAIIKFCHTFCSQDAWEFERFGYKKARISSKLRVLKELLELQFDNNGKFKSEINKMTAQELRSQPLGKDKSGHSYWFQSDENYQIRVYKEDLDEETWTLVAKDRDGLVTLINELGGSDGDSKLSSEDSNSLSEKPIIDTGQITNSSDNSKKSLDEEEEDSNDTKLEIKSSHDIKLENKSSSNDIKLESKSSDIKEDSNPHKKLKVEVSDAIDDPLVKVSGNGNGVDNNAVPPIVGEEIVEEVFYVCGNGSGNDCETGNTGGENNNDGKSDENNSNNLQSNSINEGEKLVKKVPYKLGTIIDTKTDGMLTSPNKSPTKKSRWDQKEADECPETNSDDSNAKTPQKETTNNKPMFFFGRGCFPFKTPTVSPSFTGFGISTLSAKGKTESSDHEENIKPNTEKNEEIKSVESNTELQAGTSKPLDRNETNIDSKISKEITKPPTEPTADIISKPDVISKDNTALEKEDILNKTSKVNELNKSSEVNNEISNKEKCFEDNNELKEQKSKNVQISSKKAEIGSNLKETNILLAKQRKETDLNENPKENKLQTIINKRGNDINSPEDNSKNIIDDKLQKCTNKENTENDLQKQDSKLDESILDLSSKPKLVEKSEVLENSGNKLFKEIENEVKAITTEPDRDKSIENESAQKSMEKVPTNQLTESIDAEKLKDFKVAIEEPICIKKSAYICGSKDLELSSKEDSETLKVTHLKPEEKLQSDQKSPNKVTVTIVDILPSANEVSNDTITILPMQVSSNLDSKNDCPNVEIKKNIVKTSSPNSIEDKSNSLKTKENFLREQNSENTIKKIIKDDKCPTSVSKSNKEGDELEDNDKNSLNNITTKDTTINDSKKLNDDVQNTLKISENLKKSSSGIEDPKHITEIDKKNEVATEKSDDATEKNIYTSKDLTTELKDDTLSKIETIELKNSPSDIVPTEEKDPLEVSDKELAESETNSKPLSLQTFSMDFNESSETALPPLLTRTLRKRAHENVQVEEKNDEVDTKKMKLKGKRPVDKQLRKSVEEKKELICISSDDDDDIEPIEVEDVDNEAEKKKPQLTRKGKRGKLKKGKKSTGEEASEESKTPKKKADPAQKNKRLLANLGITSEQQIESITSPGVRQSRRLAQLKIKEITENKRSIPIVTQSCQSTEKKSKKVKKDEKRKRKKEESDASVEEVLDDDDDDDNEEVEDVKKKKKRKKHKDPSKIFDEKKPWKSSSDDSTSEEGGEEEEEYEEEDEPLVFKSDHEFSPESDMENDEDWQPMKRARTARKESDVEEEVDDCNCQKCGKSDHPEWILLCDKCDNGWHCSCLRPPLLVIPEGDWFCPPCQHFLLLEGLKQKLVEYDKKLSKKEIEDRRKERLAYVGISLNNVLPSKGNELKKKREADEHDMSSAESSESNSESEEDSESDSDEPIYQLRQRKRAQSYKFNDYDEMIKSAIQDEMEAVKGAGNQGRGKDIANIVNAEREEVEEKTTADATVEASVDDTKMENKEELVEEKTVYSDDEPIKVRKLSGKKKHRKLNSLDISSSDDGDSDEDFKGSESLESEDDFVEDLESEDSEDDVIRGGRRGKSSGPVRRSTRARVSRYDADFINDDTDDEGEPQRKKKRSIWDESEESEESDRSWGRRKRNKSKCGAVTAKKKQSKKKKKKKRNSDSDVEYKKKPRIKYGGLESSDEGGRRTRTRGKKTTYVDTLGSDTDEDLRRNKNKFSSDEDEDFIANEEEEIEEDDKISEEDEEDDDEDEVAPIKKKITDKKPVIKDDEDNEDEMTTTIEQINKNLEEMDENEMEKMMEEEEYANKQLKMVALQLEKEKKRKEKEKNSQNEQKMAVVQQPEIPSVIPQSLPNITEPVQPPTSITSAPLLPTEVPLINYLPPQPASNQPNPMLSNISTLIHNEEGNDELSEPPGVSLPLFSEIVSNPAEERKPRKRRIKFTAKKKNVEETSINLSGKEDIPKTIPSQVANIEIAAPPQPFSQNQPAPSVITRMLQSKPPTSFPVIRAKSFTSPSESIPSAHPPTEMPLFRPQFPHNYPVIQRPHMRGPPPNIPPNVYSRSLDPSPSGGGPINMTTDINRSRFSHPPAAPLRAINMMRPPYPTPPPGFYNQYPDVMAPPPSTVGEPGSFYEYGGPDGPPPPTATAVVASEGGKYDEESGGGEFGGLVSYFSSQREDDLES